MTVNTELYGPAREMAALLFHSDTEPPDSVTLFALGAEVEVEVSTHDGEHCVHWVDIRDYSNPAACGSKWGWASAVWDPDMRPTREGRRPVVRAFGYDPTPSRRP